MTLPEIVAVRAMYREVLPADTAQQHHKWLQRGAVQHLVETRVPPREEPRLVTPAAAVARIREINHEVAERLLATGVSILGDVGALVSDEPSPGESESEGPVLIDPQIAALLVAGLYRAAAAHAANAEQRVAALRAAATPPTRSIRSRAGRWLPRRSRR